MDGAISEGRPHLDKRLQAINGCTRGRIWFLHGQATVQAAQFKPMSPKQIYIQTMLNGLSRLCVCVCAYMYVCLCIYVTITKRGHGFERVEGTWDEFGVEVT